MVPTAWLRWCQGCVWNTERGFSIYVPLTERPLRLISFSMVFYSEHCTFLYSFRTPLTEEENQSWCLSRFSLATYFCLKQTNKFHPPVFWSPAWKSINIKINTFYHPVRMCKCFFVVLLIGSGGFLHLFRPKGRSFNNLWTVLTSRWLAQPLWWERQQPELWSMVTGRASSCWVLTTCQNCFKLVHFLFFFFFFF